MRHVASLRIAALVAASALVLTGCGGTTGKAEPGPSGGTGATSGTTSDSTSAPTTPPVDPAVLAAAYGVDVPAGVNLTTPGTTLTVGQSATVAWAPSKNIVGALLLKVTRLRKGTIKDFEGFEFRDSVRESTPYYVDVTVQNVGRTNLSGIDTPLYLLDQTGTLYGQNHFGGTFKPCAAKPLPAGFKAGKTAKVCLVYLAPNHGTLTAISFRPTQEFNPITWTGTVIKPTTKPTKKPTAKR